MAEISTGLRRPWKSWNPDAVWKLVRPKEHGSWSLALEPVTLGLLAAPSRAGIFLAVAAVAGFFLRRPLKLLRQTPSDPRGPRAAFCAVSLILAAASALLLAVQFASAIQLWPLIPVLCAGTAFVWFDFRNENREGAAEIAGATSFALLPATFAALAGWRGGKFAGARRRDAGAIRADSDAGANPAASAPKAGQPQKRRCFWRRLPPAES